MENKTFKGKIIYNPEGKAKEYSLWAANFYNGCVGCHYCYLKKGVLSTNWHDKPILKKSLIDEENAFVIFKKEIKKNLESLKEHGLFFNFSSDPCLPETKELNWLCIDYCLFSNIPVVILTKQTGWVSEFLKSKYYENIGSELKIGFTLTGHDELEPGCSPHYDRTDAMKKLKEAGYYVWASIEPIININDSTEIVNHLIKNNLCNHYKIGLESGKSYEPEELRKMFYHINKISLLHNNNTIYWKDSFLNKCSIWRKSLPSNCIDTF